MGLSMFRHLPRAHGTVSGLALLAALGASAAHAEADAASAAPADSTRLTEIVVTAARRSATALSTPINISAISGGDLAKAGVADFQSLSRVVPGLVYNGTSIRNGGATNSFVIHGLNLDDVANSGDEPLPTVAPVSVYIGETPAFVNLHLADIQRVEVLRGPQATLYGDASIAGTVRILPNEPDPTKLSAEISGSGGWTRNASGPNYTFDGVVNVPVSSDAALRVAGGYVFDNGFINAPSMFALDGQGVPVLANPADVIHSLPVAKSVSNIDNSDLAYVRPMFLYKKDAFKLLLTYQYQHEHADGDDIDSYPGGPAPTSYSSTLTAGFQNDGFDAAFPSTFKPYQSGAFLPSPYSRDVHLVSTEASYDFGFATLTSVTSFYDNSSLARTDNSGFYEASLGFLYSGYPRLALDSHRQYNDDALIEEVRLVSKSTGKLTYSIGGFYMNEDNHYLQNDLIPGFTAYSAALGAPTGTDLAYRFERRFHFFDLAGFGQATWHVTPRWQVTGGARVYQQTLALDSTIELPICGVACSDDGVSPLGLSGGGNKQVNNNVLMNFNSSYELGDGLLAFATFSQGERRGGANGVPTKGVLGASPEFLFFKPDTVDNYEVGLKGRIGHDFQFSSAFYWVEWHNPQVNVSTPVGAFPAVVNGDKARSQGIDLDARYRLTQSVTLNATYSYNHSQLLDAIEVGGVNYGAAGTRLPGTPEHTGSLGADYEHSLKGDLAFTGHADVSYRSDMTTSLTPSLDEKLTGFAIVNLSAELSRGPWRVGLFVDNLTNTRGVVSANPIGPFGSGPYDARSMNNRLSRPLTAGLKFGYKFE
jgi:outer membrane receptor protein involved in Fe transport